MVIIFIRQTPKQVESLSFVFKLSTKMQINIFENEFPSPDGNGKPCEIDLYFFLL